ncbi:nuclear transport factor 2 family protein [Saccharopolyspora sp. K220]|uniref:nuclear transport factor 2 family protein n=1 Tax=Saccharopolyspora soli TaxID=2926618 RepID=UPI001F58EDC0|nr:nuclear transport factor 2 family protein [Saccharopolyspora soli]MCI2418381.1 nuclear transport factor 2 family protein [Saccharopolyspora soli]
MTNDLPAAVNTYLATSKSDLSPLLGELFTDDAVVHDDGRTYHGLAAIRAWTDSIAAGFNFTRTVTDTTLIGNAAIVLTEVAGDFPGSPVDLHHHFSLAEDKISALTICT